MAPWVRALTVQAWGPEFRISSTSVKADRGCGCLLQQHRGGKDRQNAGLSGCQLSSRFNERSYLKEKGREGDRVGLLIFSSGLYICPWPLHGRRQIRNPSSPGTSLCSGMLMPLAPSPSLHKLAWRHRGRWSPCSTGGIKEGGCTLASELTRDPRRSASTVQPSRTSLFPNLTGMIPLLFRLYRRTCGDHPCFLGGKTWVRQQKNPRSRIFC